MKLCSKKFAFLFFAAVALATTALAADFSIRNGDRVVFLGDSITEQRLYTTYIEAYTLTRHPDWKLTFRNVGWGGDTSWLRKRVPSNETNLFAADDAAQQEMVETLVGRGLKRDVLPLKPTFVTVKFGMNDHAYQKFREDIFRAYVRSQGRIAEVLEGGGARVAFLTPQPIEDKRPDPDQDARNQSLRKFSEGLEEVAARKGALFIDQFDPFMAILMRERYTNPPDFIGGGVDSVHPGPAGHTVMAWIILKGLGAPSLVSRAEIDSQARKVASAERCQIRNLKVSAGSLGFDRLDEALPMPIDSRAESALKLAPILDDLNRYELRITGLSSGTYELSIDSEPAGKATQEELAAGWNLSKTAGPITSQAQQVMSLVFKKNNRFHECWRNVQIYQFPDWAQCAKVEKLRKARLDQMDREIAAMESEIDRVRKPKSHHFELKLIQ